MKFSVRSMLLIVVLMHSSVQGMSQKFKKIKNPKVNEKFFNVQSKKFNIKPQYQNVGDKDIISPTAYQPVKNSPAKTSSKLIKVKAEEMPREAWKTEKDQKLEPSKKQNAKGFSPNKVSQRNYSTVKGAPFKKEFGLLDAKKAEAEALQKLRYETNEARKVALVEKVTTDLEQGKSSLLKDEEERKRFGKFMSPKSTPKFIGESIDLSKAKKLLINKAKEKGIYIPLDASEEVRLAYGWGIENIRVFFKDPRYQPFIPMIDRALTEEKKALEQGKPVLYHGLKKDYYKYMYFCTKIMELKELSYPGFLMLRGFQKDYTPEGKSTTIRKSFLKEGSQNDLINIKDRYHLLSAGNSLFINFEKNQDVHPLYLIVRDESATDLLIDKGVSKINIDLEAFCKKYQLEDYYTKIWDIFRSTDIKSDGGILLQFIFDKEVFNQTVYASYPGGRKRENSSKIIKNMPNVATLDNETLIRLQSRIILTDDFLLNPTNPAVRKGFKVNAYAQDQKALHEFQTKVDEPFDGIMKELMQKKKKEPQQKTRTWREYFRSFFARGDRGS